MADNVTVDNGSGTDYVVATDDDGSAQHQYVKVEFGADNTQTKVTTSTGLPVQGTGSAGSAAGGVVTVQGVASMTPVTVDSELTTADVDTGAGTDTRAVVGLVGTASGGGQLIPGSSTDGLLVNLGANNDVTVTGTVTATLAAGTNTNEVVGDVAQDAAVAGNPVLAGARASDAVPTAMSADGDAVYLWARREGGLVVEPRVRQLDIAVTPTIDTAAYQSGDRLGSVMTFANAALVSGGTGTIVKAVLHDEAASNFDIWLHLFKVSPTLVNADNGVLDITDANLASAIYVATIKFLTTDTKSFGTSNRVCEGTWLGGPPAIPYTTSGSSSLFGVLEARGAYDAIATDDIIVTLSVIRD